MLGRLKGAVRRWLAAIMKDALMEQRRRVHPADLLAEKSDPSMKVAQKLLYACYGQRIHSQGSWNMADAGFRVFSQFDEDGILLYLFAAIGAQHRTFVDIGSGDGINSNCANLALNFGWNGLFIAGDPGNIARGRAFYEKHPDTWAYPPRFLHSFVQRENINELIKSAGFSGPVDLVSIDIDGNDYWIWDALTVIEPRVVVIETHTEFGLRSIVVPYDKDYAYPGKHPDYHGASPVAMAKLAARKGYRLVGANRYGFNTFYVKNGEGDDIVPAVPVESVIRHPRNRDREQLFKAIQDWHYEEV